MAIPRGRLAATCLGLLAGLTAGQALARPVRAASVTVCGDEFLFRLADPDQIALISAKADGPLAVFPERAKGFRKAPRDVEAIVAADVDLVLLESGGGAFNAALKRLGVGTVMLPFDAYKISDMQAGIRRVARALGHPERAEPIIADMNARIAKLEAQRPPLDQRPIALYVRPEGGGAAAKTYVDTVLTLAGFRNMQSLAGQKGWKRMNMEDVVMHPPQVFVTSFFDTQKNSLIDARGRYPLLGKFNAPVLEAPGRLLTCAGPSAITAAEILQAQRLKYFPQTRVKAP